MDDLSAILEQLSKEAGKSEAEIKKLISKKQKELSGLVSDVGAAHIVASELGILLESKPSEQSRFKIHDLIQGMSCVDIFARVSAVFEPREFKKKSGEQSKVASVELTDETGKTRLVLWGENADLVKKLHKNDAVHVHSAYVRTNRGAVEIHLGSRGYLDINPEDAPELPEAKEALLKISHLTPGASSVDMLARVIQVFGTRGFTRQDGAEGKVATIMLGDETGTIRCSCWDDAADRAQKLTPGDLIKLENAYTRAGLQGVELQVGWRGRFSKAPKASALPPLNKFRETSERARISALSQGDQYKEVKAAIVEIFPGEVVFSFCPNCNKKADSKCPDCGAQPEPILILNALLDDGTAQIRGVFYRTQAEKLLGFTAKEALKLKASGKDLVSEARRILGTELLVSGNVKHNEYFSCLELVAREVSQPNPIKEADIIITRIENPIPVIIK
ncbi:MAG: OB-fold nucleic acid binding domain-containing protein [archaeon]